MHPGLPRAVEHLEQQRSLMNGVLSAMTPDAENEIVMETSYYDEMS